MEALKESLLRVRVRKSKKFHKEINLLSANYIDKYKAKIYIIKMVAFWVAIFIIYIAFDFYTNNLIDSKVYSLSQIYISSENYIESNELVFRINSLNEVIQNTNNMLLSFGSYYEYERYINHILEHTQLMHLTDITLNVNRASVTIGLAGNTSFLPIVVDNILSSYFYNLSIRSSSSHSLGVRFVIDFYIDSSF